jgi:hypothetical protein
MVPPTSLPEVGAILVIAIIDNYYLLPSEI